VTDKKKIVVLVQARMGSSRLPGKTLMKVGGKTLLELQIERLRQSKNAIQIIVATTNEPEDDAIVEACENAEILCFRGSSLNVAERLRGALLEFAPDAFVRFCADRPFYDYRLLDSALKLYNEGEYDIVTNVCPPSFPKGGSA